MENVEYLTAFRKKGDFQEKQRRDTVVNIQPSFKVKDASSTLPVD